MNINIPEISIPKPISNVELEYYVLDGSRIWSIAGAKFVDSMPDGSGVCRLDSDDRKTADEYLIGCLDFYGYPKGELRTDAEFAADAREKRNALLAETDYLMMPDYPLPEEEFQAVAAYRQALRDVPMQAGFPRRIDWPVKP